ncbi:MAG: hypothetical protein QME81_03280 [bacterium]|nr:hypothetical protein [bacterium]
MPVEGVDAATSTPPAAPPPQQPASPAPPAQQTETAQLEQVNQRGLGGESNLQPSFLDREGEERGLMQEMGIGQQFDFKV